MIERETIDAGLSHAAWGCFFLFFDFNLGTVSIFPKFAGFLLFLSAIGKLSGERRDLELLRPLCILLALWHGADWLLSWGGAGVEGRVVFLDLLVRAAALYFHFQFLTDMAALAEAHQPEESDLDGRLRSRRSAQTVVTTGANLALCLPEGDVQTGVVFVLGLVGCVVALSIMFGLFELRRYVRDEGGTEMPDRI